ncbi:MAG: AMP-binding protein [Paracoccaceae bacterium]|nr:AMP-binding protein [Paracoccaceae bacterium]
MNSSFRGQLVVDTLPKLLNRNASQFSNSPAYRVKEFGIWRSWSWSQARDEINAFSLGLLDCGVDQGDHVAIIGSNRPELYWSMVAAQSIGAIPVPVYQDAVPEEMIYILEHCNVRFIVAEDQEQVDKVIELSTRLKRLEQTIFLDPRGMRKYEKSKLTSFADVQSAGRKNEKKLSILYKKRFQNHSSVDTCVMLYTSGTTGKPKGVVLSHKNILAASKASSEFDNLRHDDSVLAYLPMAWVGDFIFSIGQAYWTGFCVACPESAETMQTDLREIGPSYFFAPPRYFEGLLTSVMIRMEDASSIKRKVFNHMMEFAKKVGPKILDNKPISFYERGKYIFANFILYSPLKDTLGLRNVRVGYTAGEAIGPEIFDFYRSLGINLKQLYGQTEAAVFITQQPDGEVRSDTVGVATPGVELKIDESGEVFYRSDSSFVEYYKNPKSTKSTKNKEGWVATGDAGFIDTSSNHLRIIDRVKDVGKMSDGSFFAPKYVENKLKFYPTILEAVVLGDKRDICTAFINIDLTAVGNWAERNNIAYSSYQELAAHDQVYDMIARYIKEVNLSISKDKMLSSCQIRRFLVLHKELDADDGEITRTRKVRRGFIEEKYADLVKALYNGASQIETKTEVTYEDGRKGHISATLEIRDAEVFNPELEVA